MELLDRAVELIRETESKLRELLMEATRAGDYATVVHLAEWAKTIHLLTDRGPEPDMPGHESGTYGTKQSRGGISSGTAVTRGRVTGRRGRDSYPRFYRRGDCLIRSAWSKKEKKEYHHKASHGVLQTLTKAMLERGADGRVFSTDEVLPIEDPTGTGEIPNYQAYVGISLLKYAGLIEQHGRRGYSIPRTSELEQAVEKLWGELPEQ